MSMLIQQVHAQQSSASLAPPSITGWHAPETLDPLVDRAMALAKIGAWSCNLKDNRLSWSSGVFDLFGLPAESAPDCQQTVEMYTEESRESLERLRTQAIAARGNFTLDAQIVRVTGDMRWMRITVEMSYNAFGEPLLHGLKQDITEEKLRCEELRRLAENDALTVPGKSRPL
jgi:PAS domain S-box-containing protein